MKTNTAAGWGGWDDDEVTVVDSWRLAPGGQTPLVARTDAYARMTDTGIRAAFRCDTGSTHQDLTAVTS